jgi:hypothetical protein
VFCNANGPGMIPGPFALVPALQAGAFQVAIFSEA